MMVVPAAVGIGAAAAAAISTPITTSAVATMAVASDKPPHLLTTNPQLQKETSYQTLSRPMLLKKIFLPLHASSAGWLLRVDRKLRYGGIVHVQSCVAHGRQSQAKKVACSPENMELLSLGLNGRALGISSRYVRSRRV